MVEYEFTEEQNRVIKALSKWMLILAIVVFISGVVTVVQWSQYPNTTLVLTQGIMYIIFAVTIYLSTNNFKSIVDTEGSDIKELMIAFNKLDKGWLITNIATAINRVLELPRLLLILLIFLGIIPLTE